VISVNLKLWRIWGYLSWLESGRLRYAGRE